MSNETGLPTLIGSSSAYPSDTAEEQAARQIVGTPKSFINAVQKRFGPITWDLAGNSINHKGPPGCYYGPGSAHGENSFAEDWRKLFPGNLWLNPTYNNICKWTQKIKYYRLPKDTRIFLLVPAMINSVRFYEDVYKHSLILSLLRGIAFNNHKTRIPLDMILAVYGEPPGFEVWPWKNWDY